MIRRPQIRLRGLVAQESLPVLTADQALVATLHRGNVTETARLSGLHRNTVAKFLKLPQVGAYIEKRRLEEETKALQARELSSAQIRAIWSELATDLRVHPMVRLRATELLAKSRSMFVSQPVEQLPPFRIVVSGLQPKDGRGP
ncbi:MAG: hypothetical protein KA184_20655 [Candidatus Hydrogenedentes bacterium]|nr:hypothetical protein [Candidatus Hydrogenedentota bacterium]